jgi:5'-deoxynucleotidase YfbR-like HD superfamily hydrolase
MNNPTSKAGELRTPGVLRTLAGNYVDLTNLKPEDVEITDIAWGLGRTLRYGGHLAQDYHVAEHCIVMSYIVPEEHALEALLHDAAEAYMGDIIWPVKALFPEVSQFEDEILHIIMQAFEVETATVKFAGGPEAYVKRECIKDADNRLMEHECFSFNRPGIYHEDIERAWLKAVERHSQWWGTPTYMYLERFAQLYPGYTFDTDHLTKLWFEDDGYSEKAVEQMEQAVQTEWEDEG